LALCTGDSETSSSPNAWWNWQRHSSLRTPARYRTPRSAGFALTGVEVVIPGDANAAVAYVGSRFTRRSVLVTGSGTSSLLEARRAGSAYVCRAGVCQLPVDTVTALEEQLRNVGA